jgi:DnaD/phage-associated family protein
MSFCTFSSEAIIEGKITVDNLFIYEFMPSAPENCTKVYLYGLYNCTNSSCKDNDIESFSRKLGLSIEEIEDCFHYWKQQGLVQILDTIPFQVKYLPADNVLSSVKKYKKEKYENFNVQAQEILKSRMITPNEYKVYYDLIEREHFEQDALLMIMKYCTNLKGNNIGHAYISTVAKNWANENITTSERVEERLKEYELLSSQLGALYKTMGIKRAPYIEERDLYNKWVKILNFDEESISQIAKFLKKKKLGLSFNFLDKQLEKYQSIGTMSLKEIMIYEENQDILKDSAMQTIRQLGLYYENLEPVIERYIQPWAQMGYEKDGLLQIAQFCFNKGYRTLNSMESVVKQLFKLGVISSKSINQYINEVSELDQTIKALLQNMGIYRNVNSQDRTFYNVWKFDWKIDDKLITFASEQAKDKAQPTVYLNKMLSNYYENNVDSIEKAKELASKVKEEFATTSKKTAFKGRSYSKQELNALFDTIDEIEV